MSLTTYTQEAQTKLFNETGAFFAFSQSQFSEKAKDGVEYVSLGAGMIAPKQNVEKLNAGLITIRQDAIKRDLAENGKRAIIVRELSNFECYYTGDISDVCESLSGYGITHDEILSVFNGKSRTVDL